MFKSHPKALELLSTATPQREIELLNATLTNDLDAMAQAIEDGAAPDQKLAGHPPALASAIWLGNVPMVRLLLDAGSDANLPLAVDPIGNPDNPQKAASPLELALHASQRLSVNPSSGLAMVKLLLERGANPFFGSTERGGVPPLIALAGDVHALAAKEELIQACVRIRLAKEAAAKGGPKASTEQPPAAAAGEPALPDAAARDLRSENAALREQVERLAGVIESFSFLVEQAKSAASRPGASIAAPGPGSKAKAA